MNILNLGAGVQSSVIALMAEHGEIEKPDCAIFADTGWEPNHVYEWLDWLEDKLSFPVYRVSHGNLREDLERYTKGERCASVPFFTETNQPGREGRLRRNCTRDYKIDPIKRKIRGLLGLKKGQRVKAKIVQWIGISMDEINRMKPAQEPWVETRWPLIEKGMTRNDCLFWMTKNNLPLPKKSSCIGCPYHNDATWRDMKMNHPEEWEDAIKVDQMIRNGVRGTKQKLFLHRSLIPLEDIDFRNLEDMGQLNMFDEECEGICGV